MMELIKSWVATMPALPTPSLSSLPDIVKNKYVLIGIAVAVLAVLIASAWFFRAGATAKLVPAEVAKQTDYDVYLDVRSKEEVEATGDLPGSLHVPLEIVSRLKDQLPLTTSILVYCNTGRRAKQAATELTKLGFEHVEYTDVPYTALLRDPPAQKAPEVPEVQEPKAQIEHVG